MVIKVKLFGPMGRAAGRSEVEVPLDVQAVTCGQLRARLSEQEPALAPLLPACRFAVNWQFAAEDCAIGATDEVALVGLTSGG
jgi:molybdopterin converting factor small subunit